MATFFEQQHIARKKTTWLLFMFFLSVVAIIFATYLLLMTFVVLERVSDIKEVRPHMYYQPIALVIVASVVVLVVFVSSIVKMIRLRHGGKVIAESLGGKLIDPSEYEPRYVDLLNVVEEMAIASGVPVPPVYVLERESSINAFAAGYHPGDAVIGVTEGAATTLNRDELQGVIAHEFSHILNGDMKLNIRLIGYIAGILSISGVGMYIMSTGLSGRTGRSRTGKGANAWFALGIGLVIIGSVGWFLARLIKAAVSRQREFLADAASVQFTRNPAGIYSALSRISKNGSRVRSAAAEEAAHMFFSNGMKRNDLPIKFFATHPPLKNRMEAIEANVPKKQLMADIQHAEKMAELRRKARQEALESTADNKEARVDSEKMFKRTVVAGAMIQQGGEQGQQAAGAMIAGGMAAATEDGKEMADVLTTAAMAGSTGAAEGGREEKGSAGQTALSSIGGLDDSHIEYARKIIQEIPDEIKDSAHESFGARAVVYCLLFERKDQKVRKKQVSLLRSNADPDVFELARKLARPVAALPVRCRIPLIEMTLPALLELSEGQYRAFKANVMAMIEADDRLDVGEWILLRILMHHLGEHFEGRVSPAEKKKLSQKKVKAAAVTVLTVVACFTDDQDSIMKAIYSGIKTASIKNPKLQQDVGLKQLNTALDVLEGLKPREKEKFMKGLSEVISFDGTVNETEAEFFRAIGDSLNVPVPPVIPGQALK